MMLLVEVFFGLSCLGILAWPFYRRGQTRSIPPITLELSIIRQRREAVYEEIRSLELEHELGRVETQDFQRRLHNHRLEAAAVIQEQEAIELRLMNQEIRLEEEIHRERKLLEDNFVEQDAHIEGKRNQ